MLYLVYNLIGNGILAVTYSWSNCFKYGVDFS